MNPSVVLTAEQRGNSNAEVRMATGIATAIKGGKCILLSVPLVAKIHRYLSSLEKGDPCIAASVTLKLGARLPFREANTKRKGGAHIMLPFPLS